MILRIAGPLSSSRSPLLPLSLAVMIPAWSFLVLISFKVSPTSILPPCSTLANTPSLGMMQSPTIWKISHSEWHFFPICVISSTTSLHLKILPTGHDLKSYPFTSRFSPKAPSATFAPLARNFSTSSQDNRLTCLCQLPAWASFSSPQSSIKLQLPIFCLAVPFFSLIHTAATSPAITVIPFLRPGPFLSARAGHVLYLSADLYHLALFFRSIRQTSVSCFFPEMML